MTDIIAAQSEPLRDSQNPKAIRLLVADDDEINRAIISEMVRAETGFQLTMAQDGREALEKATSIRFDVLIFDLNMPHINGDRLIRHLRASQSLNANSTMFLFTAAADSHGQLSNGSQTHVARLADQILSKPIRAKDLFGAIRAKVRR